MEIAKNLNLLQQTLSNYSATLVAISKTKPMEDLQAAYDAGQRHFGENKVQEMTDKWEQLPKDICWHMVGHLQTNKVKYLAPYVHLIHSVDSLKLLHEINKQASKHDRVIDVLLQVYIAQEDTKYGLDEEELLALLNSPQLAEWPHVRVVGLMGMASNTNDESQIRQEFRGLRSLFDSLKEQFQSDQIQLHQLSMGMSGDYLLALEEGSTLIRVGSAIFGARNYLKE